MHLSTPPHQPAAPTAVVAAIPARWGSSRLPGKPLRLLAGRPMIEHVYRRALEAPGLARVVVLTDHDEIFRVVRGFGGEAQMTPIDCASGTDRIAWAARGWSEAAVVNLQGDEPLIDPGAVGRLVEHLLEHPEDDLVTLAAPAADHEVNDPNAVKVVLDREGHALYFSRAAIPYVRTDGDGNGAGQPVLEHPVIQHPILKHIGIYGYQRPALLRLAALEPTPLERCEKLEQLRALENGLRIRVLRVGSAAPGVDTESDLERVERLLEGRDHGPAADAGGPSNPPNGQEA